MESIDLAPTVVLLDTKERKFYSAVLKEAPKNKFEKLTIDDLRRAIAHLQELLCFNLSLYERVLTVDKSTFPMIDSKTARRTVDLLKCCLETIDRSYV